MALREVIIAGIGPFEYEDTDPETPDAISTDGTLNVGDLFVDGLTTNIRLLFSDITKKIDEVDDLGNFIGGTTDQIDVDAITTPGSVILSLPASPDVTTGFKVAGTQVVGAQQTAISDPTIGTVGTAVAGVDGTGSNAASKADVDTRLTDIQSSLDSLESAVDAILTALRTHGLIDT